jgi:hydrogenase maturation protein HypF
VLNVATKRNGQAPAVQRLRVNVRGAVQGVGFRPLIYRLAYELSLVGWVNNSSQGLFIEVEGDPDTLKTFLFRLSDEKPPRSFIQSIESSYLDAVGFTDFQIRKSDESGAKTTLVLPDIATCPDCLADILDRANRRYRYPFTNCTNCGPRFSIIESLPYDRANTTMKAFQMCSECLAEYEAPTDRRFHAQPNACPNCGPRLDLWNADGTVVSSGDNALVDAANAICVGQIVAVKGIGGFHLVVGARDDRAIKELRRRKRREEKPFAVMFPSLATVKEASEVSELEERLLLSPESPIVLLKKIPNVEWSLSESIAPGNPYIGAMLPYTPLHHLLMKELGFPVIATSGNLSDEPICIDESEALSRLSGIADRFLVHDRPIVRHVDDSIVRVMMGREMVLRRARGFAPLPVSLKSEMPSMLAVGAHLKNSVAVSTGRDVFVSQHIGDLETSQAFGAFRSVIKSLENLYEVAPSVTACDKHPDYLSTHWAQEYAPGTIRVQHHYAHVLSCMAENEIGPPVLGIAWDGTGYGDDGTIWGGEFLRVGDAGFDRVAHLRKFMLPGGDLAVKEPRRSAIGLLYEIFGEGLFDRDDLAPVRAFSRSELAVIRRMLNNKINSPETSSAGRLFDAVSGLIGLKDRTRFEGQAAMELEFIADEGVDGLYGFEIDNRIGQPAIVNWELTVRSIIADLLDRVANSIIAAKFHNTLAEMMVSVARKTCERHVALSGGCFQNKYLIERAIKRLREEGFNVYWHQRVPTNDGGIALGQIMAAAAAANHYVAESKKRRTELVCA